MSQVVNNSTLRNLRFTQDALDRVADSHRRNLKGQRDGRRAILVNCNLSKLDLSEVELSKAELIGCNFDRCKVHRAVFRGANLFGASFVGANSSGAGFENADLRGAIFEDADLTSATFTGADMRDGVIQGREAEASGSRFTNARLDCTNLTNTKLKGADFAGAVIMSTNFAASDLRQASFRGSEIRNVNFKGAQLHGADVTGADLDKEALAYLDSIGIRPTPPREITKEELERRLAIHLLWIQSNGQQGQRADLRNCNLAGFDLSGKNFCAVDLRLAILSGANLRNTRLLATDLRRAVLNKVDATGADLRGANLLGAATRGMIKSSLHMGELPGTGLRSPSSTNRRHVRPRQGRIVSGQQVELARPCSIPSCARRPADPVPAPPPWSRVEPFQAPRRSRRYQVAPAQGFSAPGLGDCQAQWDAAPHIDQIEMAGIGREDGRHAAGNRFHRGQVGAALGPAEEERHIGLAQDAWQAGIGQRAEMHDLVWCNAVRHGPAQRIGPAFCRELERHQIGAFIDVHGTLRPGRAPGRHQQRVGMPPGEALKGAARTVLALAPLELAAGEDDEAIAEQASARRRVEQRRIDALQHQRRLADAGFVQYRLVPARTGHDKRIALRPLARLRQDEPRSP